MFMSLLTDPFMGRGGSVNGAIPAPGYADESASAYAAQKRLGAERDVYAMFTKAPLAKVFEPRWSVWAAGYGGSQSTGGNAAVGSNNTTSRIAGTAVGADYLLLAEYAGRLCARRRRHEFQRRQWSAGPLRPVPGRRVCASHHRRRPMSPPRSLMAGRTSPPTAR